MTCVYIPTAPKPSLTENDSLGEATPLLSPFSHSSELRGYIFMFISCFFFSIFTFISHVLTIPPNPLLTPMNVVFIRSSLELLTSSIFLFFYSSSHPFLTPRKLKLLFFRGVFGASGLLLVFYSLKYLPLGQSLTIFFINPILTMLISAAALGESVSALEAFAAALSFAGVILVANPTATPDPSFHYEHRLFGSASALSAAFLCAVAYVIARSLGKTVHFMTQVFALSAASMFISVLGGGVLSVSDMIKLGSRVIIPGYIAAAFSVAGQCCLSLGFQYCRAGTGAVIRNFDVPFGYVLGLVFLGEMPSWSAFWGSVLVVAGTVLVGLKQMMKK